MINYENSSENNTKFVDFLCDLDLSCSDFQSSRKFEKQNELKSPQIINTISNYSCETSTLATKLDENILGLEFLVHRSSTIPVASRKI